MKVKIWKEVVVAYFKVLYRHSLGETKEPQNPSVEIHSKWPVRTTNLPSASPGCYHYTTVLGQ